MSALPLQHDCSATINKKDSQLLSMREIDMKIALSKKEIDAITIRSLLAGKLSAGNNELHRLLGYELNNQSSLLSQKGILLSQRRNWQEAVKFLTQSLSFRPDDLTSLKCRRYCYLQMKNNAGAVTDQQKIEYLTGKNAEKIGVDSWTERKANEGLPKEIEDAIQNKFFLRAKALLQSDKYRQKPICMYTLATFYLEGIGVSRNHEQAYKLLTLAASNGCARAEMSLGQMYEDAIGLPEDLSKAAYWYERAALHGLPEAAFRLSSHFLSLNPYDFAEYRRKGIYWLRYAAQHGNSQAQRDLAESYLSGSDIAQSDKLALKYFKLAADKGLKEAQVRTADLYRLGRGTQSNLALAAKYYEMAARQKHHQSALMLSQMYLKGSGVPRSLEKATYWKSQAQAVDNVHKQDRNSVLNSLGRELSK
jgi:hypothetical protein